MKKLLFLFFCCSLGYVTLGQSSSEIGKIALSVVMPENVDALDASQLSKLEAKITQIVTNSGMAATGYNNNFVIYPKFSIYETNVAEGGMQNITVVTAELSLFIKQVENNLLFSSVTKSLKGSGANKSNAITNAISKIVTNDQVYQTFIETGKNKIIQYYESKCNDILSKAESLDKKQDYEGAMGLLMTVPESVSCYNKMMDKSIEIFKHYQNHRCAILLNEARANAAANNYSMALQTITEIDPSSSCFKDAQALMKKMETSIDAEQKKQWDFQMKAYNDQVSLQKLRINAIKEVAVAYYSHRPSIQYNLIVR